MRRVYLDYATTTPLDPNVMRAMEPFLSKKFGNAGSLHAEGVAARKVLVEARAKVARVLEAHPDEIVFTSGGTEANNLAISGVTKSFTRSDLVKPHVVTTNIEHVSVLEPLKALEREGRAEVTYVPVEANGIVKAEKVLAAVRPNTVLVSVMYANNEIGTIQPVRRIGQLLQSIKSQKSPRVVEQSSLRGKKAKGQPEKVHPFFHIDACQAPLYLRCLVNALGVDLMTLDGHKIYGPKGVGALYVRRGTLFNPIMFGGGQERGLRPTTENVPGIVGFAEALRIASAERERESARLATLRDHLYSNILQNTGIEPRGGKAMIVNGGMKGGERLPNNLNISIPGVDTEFLTLRLDAAHFSVSTKSACTEGERKSHVVKAISGDTARASSTLRITLGRDTKKSDLVRFAKTLSHLLKT